MYRYIYKSQSYILKNKMGKLRRASTPFALKQQNIKLQEKKWIQLNFCIDLKTLFPPVVESNYLLNISYLFALLYGTCTHF